MTVSLGHPALVQLVLEELARRSQRGKAVSQAERVAFGAVLDAGVVSAPCPRRDIEPEQAGRWISTAKAASLLSTSDRTVRRLCARGELDSRRRRGEVLEVDEVSVRALIESRRGR